MNKEYISGVINNIVEICNIPDEKDLYIYLNELDEETITIICAMMDFGRSHLYKVFPINLYKFFEKSTLNYWIKKNKSEGKISAIKYLLEKKLTMLVKFLLRAKELLLDSNEYNIELKHHCNGDLILDDVDGIIQVGYDDFELNLICLDCRSKITKIVSRDYLENRI